MQRSLTYLYLSLAFATAFFTVGCKPTPVPPDYSDYQLWSSKAQNAENAKRLNAYLRSKGVDKVVPLYQLLRSDVRWKACGAEPFSVPPTNLWPHMVPTLRIIRDKVVPVIGPVEALSVFRTSQINGCIKGASKSFHMQFHAIDMRPTRKMSRDEIILKLCRLYRREGAAQQMGLGIYRGTRFHVDAAGYRTWGRDYKSTSSPCRSIVAPQHNLR
jgi:hypothetical protein